MRLKNVILDGEDAPDVAMQAVIETPGTLAEPMPITSLPFGDVRSTALATSDAIDGYPGCDNGQDESGNEVVYRLDLEAATEMRFMVMSRGDADIDLHVLSSLDVSGGEASGCVERHNREIVMTLAAGTHYIVLDTFVGSGGDVRAGEYVFVAMEEN